MKIVQDYDALYPAKVWASGRCALCGTLFDFAELGYVAETDDDVFTVCPGCANADEGERKRRMVSYARLLRGMADDLEELAYGIG